jgi:negative modulator of initiation of replication
VRTIPVEDDVYSFLVAKRQEFESVSDTLRRELRISADSQARNTSAPTSTGAMTNLASLAVETKDMKDFLQSPEFLVESSEAGRFLAILGWLYRRDPKKFEAVLELSGRSRKYFGCSSEELEERGSGVKPQRIPHSLFWADTNNDTMRKRKILASAMRVLRCADDTIREAVLALRLSSQQMGALSR